MKTVLAEQVTYFDVFNIFLKFSFSEVRKDSKIDPLGIHELEFC